MTPFFVVVGVALRLGIPVLLTIAVTWWLRRLDAQWQREGRQARAPRQPSAAPACWEIRHCPLESRQTCAAYAQPETPCWQVFRQETGELRPACVDCPVFRGAPAEALPGKEVPHA